MRIIVRLEDERAKGRGDLLAVYGYGKVVFIRDREILRAVIQPAVFNAGDDGCLVAYLIDISSSSELFMCSGFPYA